MPVLGQIADIGEMGFQIVMRGAQSGAVGLAQSQKALQEALADDDSRHLGDAFDEKPLDEPTRFAAGRRLDRQQRRFGMPLLQILADGHRIDQGVIAVYEHRQPPVGRMTQHMRRPFPRLFPSQVGGQSLFGEQQPHIGRPRIEQGVMQHRRLRARAGPLVPVLACPGRRVHARAGGER